VVGSLVASLLKPAYISIKTIVSVALVHLTLHRSSAWERSVVYLWDSGLDSLPPRGLGTAAARAHEAERSWMMTENFIFAVVGSDTLEVLPLESNSGLLGGWLMILVFDGGKELTGSWGYWLP
jgi:hypothetical protein